MLHPLVPYLLVPIYLACAWAWFLRIGAYLLHETNVDVQLIRVYRRGSDTAADTAAASACGANVASSAAAGAAVFLGALCAAARPSGGQRRIGGAAGGRVVCAGERGDVGGVFVRAARGRGAVYVVALIETENFPERGWVDGNLELFCGWDAHGSLSSLWFKTRTQMPILGGIPGA
jgi:hypothetical protein